ncbi:hypothetical protein [Actinoplanes sp. NPDC026623]|uniref:hypothetical protein n=1 Tax=Actinoplanes sp. NPDC026623 TaxID=3155610 RepID=UPI0034067956
MRKERSALAAMIGVVAALALPNPAMAAGFEWDYAVAGSVPDGLPCAAITGAKICYQHDGDRWWVKDTSEDHASAVASWQNRRNGALYREGGCRNSMGVGTWA